MSHDGGCNVVLSPSQASRHYRDIVTSHLHKEFLRIFIYSDGQVFPEWEEELAYDNCNNYGAHSRDRDGHVKILLRLMFIHVN